jgi:lysozyme
MSRLKKGGAVAALCVACTGTWEGLQTVAYKDVVGIPTVCYGETKGVKLGDRYSKAECDAMLIRRLDEFADSVERCTPSIKDAPAKRYVAHVSLAYNIGQRAYCRSSVSRLQNLGNVTGSCEAFMMWNKAGGVVWRGLTRRRAYERDMCLEGIAA